MATFSRWPKLPPGPACGLAALGLVLLLFGDVIFLRTSIAPIDYAEPLQNPALAPLARSVLPERPGRAVSHGQGDIGSGAFQFEPAQGFLAYCLRHRESPFWDPYSGTGGLGPEVLVDLKFSPVSVITAAFGGSSRSLCFVLVTLYFAAAYCILRVCTRHFGLSLGAGFVAAALYFLNGFALSNLSTPIGQPYFLAPLLLLATLAVSASLTPGNAVVALGVYVMFFATTFFPTAVLCLIVVCAVSLSLRSVAHPTRKKQLLFIHAALPLSSLLLLSFLYFPIVDAMRNSLDIVTQYRGRSTPPTPLINLLSFFTPKHFWESGFAFQQPKVPGAYDRWVQYLGILGPLIAMHALTRTARANRAVILALTGCVLTAVGQIWGIFPFTLIDHLPFFSFVRNEYWSGMVVLALALLAAYGYDAIAPSNAFRFPSWGLVGLIAGSFFLIYTRLGWPTDEWSRRYVLIFWSILAASSVLLWVAKLPRFTLWSKRLLMTGMIVEGMFYMNGLRPYRSNRDQRLAPTILWVKSHLEKPPGGRLLNIGASGVFPDWGSGLQIPELGVLHNADFPWYRTFFYRYIGLGMFLSLGHEGDRYSFSNDSLSLAGVRYIMVDRGIQPAIQKLTSLGFRVVKDDSIRLIYENPDALPRSFSVSSLRKVGGVPWELGSSAATVATSTDRRLCSEARRLGIPESIPKSDATLLQPERSDWTTVREYHDDRIRIRCKLARAGVLVVTDSWSPRWQATVDGKPAYIGVVDMAFRGIAIPAGEHDVAFWYLPFSLVLGKAVSAGCLVVLGLLLWGWTRMRVLRDANAEATD